MQNTEPTEPVPTEPATEPTVEPTAEPTEPTAPDTKATEGTQPALPTEPSAAEPTEPMKEKEKEGVCWWVTAMIGVVCFVLGGTLVGILLWKKKE